MSETYNSAQIPAEPSVVWKHVDGPMMVRRDHTLKWLTMRERFMHWIGAWSLLDIEARP